MDQNAGSAADAAAATKAPAAAELSPAQCSARLAALFPALFSLQQPLPLKLRVQADIQARAPGVFTRKSLSAFLHRYTTGTPYLLALTRQTQRFDLDGQPAGDLAAEHREAAATELARRRTIVEARRAAEHAARREAEAAARKKDQAEQRAGQQMQQQEHAARRERAQLLRSFETSPLTPANFCALKGIAEADLEAQLALARKEAAERPAMPPASPRQTTRPAFDKPAGRESRDSRDSRAPRRPPR